MQKYPGNHVQQLVGTVAQRDAFRVDPIASRERLFQRVARAIRVQVYLHQRGLRRCQRNRAGPQGVLVAGQLDDIFHPQLAFKFRRGLPRAIGLQRGNTGGCQSDKVSTHGA